MVGITINFLFMGVRFFLFSLLLLSSSLTLVSVHALPNTSSNAYVIDAVPPSAPSYLTASYSNAKVVLSWTPATDDVGITRYNIYKNGTFLTSPLGTGTTYTDTNVTEGQTYIYSTQAEDKGGNNGPKSEAISIVATSGAVSKKAEAIAVVAQGDQSSNVLPVTVYSSASLSDTTGKVLAPESIGLISVGNTLHVTWKNPQGNTFKSVRVIRKTTSFPVSVTDGTIICDGLSEVCIDKDVALRKGYYYGVYAVDQSYMTSKLVLVSGALVETAVAPVVEQSKVTKTTISITGDGSSSGAIRRGMSSVSSVSGSDFSTQSATSSSPIFFTKTLTLGSLGEEVRQLQVFLNTHGFPVATSGSGSQGYETTRFGQATQKALQAYQCSKKIVCDGTSLTTGYGVVGKTTRGYLNKEK